MNLQNHDGAPVRGVNKNTANEASRYSGLVFSPGFINFVKNFNQKILGTIVIRNLIWKSFEK